MLELEPAEYAKLIMFIDMVAAILAKTIFITGMFYFYFISVSRWFIDRIRGSFFGFLS